MKTLYLVRHAKSSWEYDVIDHERPLNDRGFKDANLVSSHLKETLELPDLVISSDAMRAKTTAMIFMKNLGIVEGEILLNHELYDFSGEDVLQFVRELDDELNSVLIFGHNHAFTHIANSLGNSYIENVPTSGLVQLEFNVQNWASIEKGLTKQTIFPKQLRG